MKVDSLIAMHRHHPVEMIGSDYKGSISERVGSLVIWGGGLFASMWLARWYTLRSLKQKGIIS